MLENYKKTIYGLAIVFTCGVFIAVGVLFFMNSSSSSYSNTFSKFNSNL